MLNGKSTPAALPHDAVRTPATAALQPPGRNTLSRRRLLLGAAATLALTRLAGRPALAAAATHPRLGPPAPFSFESLTSQAQAMAAAAYVAPAALPSEVLER